MDELVKEKRQNHDEFCLKYLRLYRHKNYPLFI